MIIQKKINIVYLSRRKQKHHGRNCKEGSFRKKVPPKTGNPKWVPIKKEAQKGVPHKDIFEKEAQKGVPIKTFLKMNYISPKFIRKLPYK